MPDPVDELRYRNWQTMKAALQTYRASVDLYRRVLEMYTSRGLRPAPAGGRRAVNGYVLGPVTGANGVSARKELLERLTPRERDVARLMVRGFTNQQIADTLVVSRGTAANHVAHILAKLGTLNRTQVAAMLAESTVPETADTHGHMRWISA